MAFPTIKFISEQPFVIKGNTPTDIHLSVLANTIGKNKLSLRLTAPSCCFADDSQELVSDIDTTAVDEISEIVLPVNIKSTLKRILVIRLIAEVTNTDGETDTSRLVVRLDSRENVDTNNPNTPINPIQV